MRVGWLIAGLVLSVSGWLLWLLPASVVLQPLAGVRLGQHVLQLEDAQGRFWHGAARWTLAGQAGALNWHWGWRSGRPALMLAASGDLELRVEALPGWRRLAVQRLDGRLQVAPWVPMLMPGASLDGTLSLQAVSLDWQPGAVPVLQGGGLFFSGGEGRYGRESATLPALWGSAQPSDADGSSALHVRNEQNEEVASLALEPGRVSVKVFRSWAAMVGASQGGASSDVIFQTSITLD